MIYCQSSKKKKDVGAHDDHAKRHQHDVILKEHMLEIGRKGEKKVQKRE